MTGAGHDGSVHTRRDSGEILQQGCAHEDHPGISAPHLDDLARTSTNGSFTCMRFCPNALAHFLFAQLQLTALGARQGPDVPETQRLEEKKIQTVKKTQLYDQRMALVAPPLLFQQRAGGGSCESDVSSPFLQAQLGALRRLLCGFWSLVPRFVFRVSCSVFRVEILRFPHPGSMSPLPCCVSFFVFVPCAQSHAYPSIPSNAPRPPPCIDILHAESLRSDGTGWGQT